MLELFVAALATCSSLPAVWAILRWRNIVDMPNPRSSHLTPVYRGGGLACIVGAAGGLGVAQLRNEPVQWGLFALVAALGLVGAVDDGRGLAAAPRLGAQVGAGGVLGWLIGHHAVWIFIGMVVIMITVNVTNFMDGINGISGLTIGVCGVTSMTLGWEHHNQALVVIGAVTAGAALGFLPANLPTARLFLGDVGSYFLGGLVGVGILIGLRDGISGVALAAPLSVYLADTGVTIVRRIARRAPLFSPHREHVYQQLVNNAHLSHSVVAMLASMTAAIIATSWALFPTLVALSVTSILLLVYLRSNAIARRWLQSGASPAIGCDSEGQVSPSLPDANADAPFDL